MVFYAPEGVELDWFSNNDPVLDIFIENNTAAIVAGDAGTSRILLMSGETILKTLTVHVKEEISAPAVTLGVTVHEPEPK